MVAHDQPADQHEFKQQAHPAGHDRCQRHRGQQRTTRLHRPGGDIRPGHVERAVGDVEDIEDAEHQRQPGCDQKEHQPELQAVQQLLQEKGRAHACRPDP